MKGYGLLIARHREAAGITQLGLAKLLGKQSKTTVARFEEESQEPTIEQVNRLAAIFPISVADLLIKMGANLYPPDSARLPNRLVDVLLQLDPESLAAVEAVAQGQLLMQRRQQEKVG